MVQGSVLNRARVFSLLKNIRIYFVAHMTSSSVGTAVKQTDPEADHLHPSSSEVKNRWSSTSAPPINLYGMHRDNFICIKLGEFRLAELKHLWIT